MRDSCSGFGAGEMYAAIAALPALSFHRRTASGDDAGSPPGRCDAAASVGEASLIEPQTIANNSVTLTSRDRAHRSRCGCDACRSGHRAEDRHVALHFGLLLSMVLTLHGCGGGCVPIVQIHAGRNGCVRPIVRPNADPPQAALKTLNATISPSAVFVLVATIETTLVPRPQFLVVLIGLVNRDGQRVEKPRL